MYKEINNEIIVKGIKKRCLTVGIETRLPNFDQADNIGLTNLKILGNEILYGVIQDQGFGRGISQHMFCKGDEHYDFGGGRGEKFAFFANQSKKKLSAGTVPYDMVHSYTHNYKDLWRPFKTQLSQWVWLGEQGGNIVYPYLDRQEKMLMKFEFRNCSGRTLQISKSWTNTPTPFTPAVYLDRSILPIFKTFYGSNITDNIYRAKNGRDFKPTYIDVSTTHFIAVMKMKNRGWGIAFVAPWCDLVTAEIFELGSAVNTISNLQLIDTNMPNEMLNNSSISREIGVVVGGFRCLKKWGQELLRDMKPK